MSRIEVSQTTCDTCEAVMTDADTYWVELPSSLDFPNMRGGDKTHYCPDCQPEHYPAIIEALKGRLLDSSTMDGEE